MAMIPRINLQLKHPMADPCRISWPMFRSSLAAHDTWPGAHGGPRRRLHPTVSVCGWGMMAPTLCNILLCVYSHLYR